MSFPVIPSTKFNGGLKHEGKCVTFDPQANQTLTVESSANGATIQSSNGDSLEILSDGRVASGSKVLDDKCVAPVADMMSVFADRTNAVADNFSAVSVSLGAGAATTKLNFDPRNVTALRDGRLAMSDGQRFYLLDVATGKLTSRAKLPADAGAIAISDDGKTAYIATAPTRIEAMDLSTGKKSFFAATGGSISNMKVIGDRLFVIDGSGAWNTQSIFARDTGNKLAASDWRDSTGDIAFSAINNRLYYLDAGVSPSDLHVADLGKAQNDQVPDQDSPYHGDFALKSPLRLWPDESKIVTGEGNIFDAASLKRVGGIGLEYTDLAFKGNDMYLMQPDQAGGTNVVVVNKNTFNVRKKFHFASEGRQLHVTNGKVYLLAWDSAGKKLTINNVR